MVESAAGSHHLPVVTIFEYFGAGADEVGRRVAEVLGLPYHAQAFSSEALEDPDQATANTAELVRVLTVLGGAYGGIESRDVVTMQREKSELMASNTAAVWRQADQGGVIVGRNGAVVLRDRPNTLHVLLTGTVKDRVARAAAAGGISEERAAARQPREDAVRAEMSLALYGWDPRTPEPYDLVINTSRIDTVHAAAAILQALRHET